MVLKGFIGTLTGVVLGGAVIKTIGSAGLPSGIGKATQVFVGLGVLGNAAKNTKGIFKFK